MKEKLGIVETISGDIRFVVKAGTVPRPDADVYDSADRKIGNVKRIFGPVDGPYVTVACCNGETAEKLLGKSVFIKGEDRDGKRKNKN